MMKFTIIDKKNWARKEYFEHYFSNVPCTYSITTELDVTVVKNRNKKIYPTMLYCIASIVNKHSEFRTTFNKNGELGIYDKMSPCYTIFHKNTETFSNLWTEFSTDYDNFCSAYERDISEYGAIERIVAKPDVPGNVFTVSMIPWVTFSGFNLNLKLGYDYLLPIFTMGKYHEQNNKIMLPLSIQVHHSVCDGFHVSRFINELQELIFNI